MVAAASFGTGFVLGSAWTVYAWLLRHGGDLAALATWRYVAFLAIETAVAAVAFFFAARAARFCGSANAYLLALLAGVVTNAITVGTYALVPTVTYGDGQFVVYVVAVGLLSAAAGWLLPKVFQVESPEAKSRARSMLRKMPFVLYALFAGLSVLIAVLDFTSKGGSGLVGASFLRMAALPWPILLPVPSWALFGLLGCGIAINLWLLYLFGWPRSASHSRVEVT